MSSIVRSPRNITPLAHSALVVTITDLVAEYELRHAFRNEGTDPIEVVYSFPVPLDSAFMGMEAELAGEHVVAQILPRTQASRDYDDAIADGNSAVLLERLEPGMLCVNLGNLKPTEDGEIVLRFAAPLHCAGGAARFSLPLVHRPRYGRTRLDELTEPRHDFAVEHPLDVEIRVRGLLGHAPVSCATHAARFAVEGDGQSLRLNQAMLDRDLVLAFDLPQGFNGRARLVRDGDAAIGMLTFSVPESTRKTGPCDLCLVLDGSGSMAGDAVAQSRKALFAVANLLGDEDRIAILRFGSTTVPLFRRPLKASSRVREAMCELVDTIDANLGGTQVGHALQAAISAMAGLEIISGRSRAIVLVTDGAVQPHEIQTAQEMARGLGIRVFVVAVGSSAGADVLAPLAADTGGVLERAVPAEPIDESVVRQLRRAREPAPAPLSINWGCPQAKPLPLAPAYAGDAVTAVAMLPASERFTAEVHCGHDGVVQAFRLGGVEEASTLRSLAGHAAWQHAADDAKEALALRYGLVTDQTSAVLVKVRADGEKVEGLPIVVPVAHMVPEGMLAAGSVAHIAMRMAGTVSSVAEHVDIPTFLLRRDDDQTHTAEKRLKRARRAREARLVEARVELDPAILAALTRALARLLLDDRAEVVTLQWLLSLMDSGWHDQVTAYLAAKCPDGVDQQSTRKLLKKLWTRMRDVSLSDDDEARLAILIRRV